MFLKLAIIACIVVLGVMVFSNELYSIFPSTSSTVVSSLVSDMNAIKDRVSDVITERAAESINKAVNETGNIISDGIDTAGDRIGAVTTVVPTPDNKTSLQS